MFFDTFSLKEIMLLSFQPNLVNFLKLLIVREHYLDSSSAKVKKKITFSRLSLLTFLFLQRLGVPTGQMSKAPGSYHH